MRDFEEDFEFKFDVGVKVARVKDCRIDSHRTLTFEPDRSGDPEHQARIAVHTERVQREIQELGITKGDRRK